MPVQNRQDYENVAFIRSGISLIKDNETLLQDAGRSVPLAYGTVMAKVAATQKWVPFTDETAVNGTAIPQGIYTGQEVAAADLVAGDVVGAAILVGAACTVDVEQLTIENSKTLGTVITVGTTSLLTVRDYLAARGIFVESTVDVDEFEN
jgi:hypothetical protein